MRVWEVRDAAGRHRGLFFGDYFARPSKHSGAWMTRLRDREKLKGDIRPLVVNVMGALCLLRSFAGGFPRARPRRGKRYFRSPGGYLRFDRAK